ncbi:MAG: hypothetical protein AB7U73_22305 [Pirellulales bacterium]
MSTRRADPEQLRLLTEVFRQHGALDPEAWARSQLEEGIPQLAIFSFAKALWEGVESENDTKWIDREIEWAKSRPGDPCAQSGPALAEMLAKEVSRQSIADLVRAMQYSTLFHACSLLDGALVVDTPVANWTLHQVDDDGKPVAIIQGLHEVLLSLDPTGREMRPRTTAQSDSEANSGE